MLREVVNRVKLCGHYTVRCSHVEVQSHVVVSVDSLFVPLSLELCCTLKIIARILREVVNRVKLCGRHTVRCSHVEVKSHVVMRRRGTLFVCLFVCLLG